MNSIASTGIELLKSRGYQVSENEERPDALLVRSVDLHNYDFNPELLCISRAGAGTNNIPVERAAEMGIVVFNTPGANAEAVKELCICSLLIASRDVIGGIEWVRSIADEGEKIPDMVEDEKARFLGPEINGKTLGVIGLGAVGAKIANAALTLGMYVYGYDPYLSVDAAWSLSSRVYHATSLDQIYRNCDYITLHIPYGQGTHHFLNGESFEKMRSGVRIINLARGELVCDEDLIAAIGSGKVARYVTDFPNELTAGIENIIPLPHLGASTPESEENCSRMAAAEIIDYLENGNISNSVNFTDIHSERTGTGRLCVIHKNMPRMISSMLETTSARSINVENLISKPSGDLAYAIIDINASPEQSLEVAQEIREREGIISVRLI